MKVTFTNEELLCYNQMLVDLYDNSDFEKTFSTFLNNLKKLIDFKKGNIYFYKSNNDHIIFDDFIFVGWSDEHLNQYINNYADMDDVLPIISLNHPVMFRSSDVFVQEERSKTRYYTELLVPVDMEYAIEGNIFDGIEGFVAGIGIHRPHDDGDFSERDLEIMKLFRPHLSTIVARYIEAKQNMENYSASLAAAYGANDVGLCVIDKDFNVIESNIESTPSINKGHANEILRAVLTLAKSITKNASFNGGLEIDSCSTQSRIVIDNNSYYAEVTCKQSPEGECNFIASIYNFGKLFDMLLAEATERYQLTDREKEILALIIQGRSNTEISKTLYISIATVKKHLTNIYNKMEIEGKHQLLSKIVE